MRAATGTCAWPGAASSLSTVNSSPLERPGALGCGDRLRLGLSGTGRSGLLLGQAGNRDDTAIADLARTAAGFAPDLVVVKELPAMLRGRAPGKVPALIEQALQAAGLPRQQLRHRADEEAAALDLLAWAGPGGVAAAGAHRLGAPAAGAAAGGRAAAPVKA